MALYWYFSCSRTENFANWYIKFEKNVCSIGTSYSRFRCGSNFILSLRYSHHHHHHHHHHHPIVVVIMFFIRPTKILGYCSVAFFMLCNVHWVLEFLRVLLNDAVSYYFPHLLIGGSIYELIWRSLQVPLGPL
jgi:hypothetical protein